MVEGGGGDNLAVRWQMPNGNFEEPLTAQSAAGTRLIPFDGIDIKPGFYEQTGNLTVIEGQNARFSVLVTNKSPVTYQWTLNGANIGGANKAFHAVSNVTVAANNGQVYRCVAANSAGSTTTPSMTLTVNPGPRETHDYPGHERRSNERPDRLFRTGRSWPAPPTRPTTFSPTAWR